MWTWVWKSLTAVPIFFHCGREKQSSPNRIRSPCCWKLRGRSPLSSFVHPSPWTSNRSWRIFSSLLPCVCPLSFFECRDFSKNRTYNERYIKTLQAANREIKWTATLITWLQTISQAVSEATIVPRDCRSSCDREDGKIGRRTVSFESFNKYKSVSRTPLDCRHLL